MSFLSYAAFVARIVQRSTRSSGEIATKGGLTRGATISDLKNGINAKWDTIDRFAKGAGFRGALEMFTSGGDHETRSLLRLWRALPDDVARKAVLKVVRQIRDADEESSAT